MIICSILSGREQRMGKRSRILITLIYRLTDSLESWNHSWNNGEYDCTWDSMDWIPFVQPLSYQVKSWPGLAIWHTKTQETAESGGFNPAILGTAFLTIIYIRMRHCLKKVRFSYCYSWAGDSEAWSHTPPSSGTATFPQLSGSWTNLHTLVLSWQQCTMVPYLYYHRLVLIVFCTNVCAAFFFYCLAEFIAIYV